MKEIILNLIYPNVCGICNKITEESLCKRCELNLEKYNINIIKDCRNQKNVHFDYCINVLKYESIIREKIIDYKFNEKSYLYKTFSQIMLKDRKICRFLQERYDIIMPIPMHKQKKRLRGYNQSELLGNQIAKVLGIPIDKESLVKEKNNETQSTLSKTQRLNNVKGAFKILNPEKISNKNVILIDDIYTTGSTLNECSKVLKKAGAINIVALTLAKD